MAGCDHMDRSGVKKQPYLGHGVCRLGFLSSHGWMGRQCDACGCISGSWRPLDTDGGRRSVDCQPCTPAKETVFYYNALAIRHFRLDHLMQVVMKSRIGLDSN